MKKLLTNLFFPLLLLLLVVILAVANFSTGTYLSGWDNLQVEFDLGINLERSLNTVWQEYQGLGLLGGMGHAADLVRQLILLPLSLIFEQSFLRYFWNFLHLFLGGLGTYFLLIYLVKKKTLAFLGASYYVLNFATIQNFYVTFEPFVSFFSFLPWVIFSLLRLLDAPTKGTLVIFCLLSLLGTGIGYIQTVFLVYLVILLVILFCYVLFDKNTLAFDNKKLFTAGKIVLLTFAINAFWLLPALFFTLTASDITVDSKANQMVTESVFLQNNRFGNLKDLLTMKGYWFGLHDFDTWGNSVYLLDPWQSHLQNSMTKPISFAFAGLFVLGVIALLFNRSLRRHRHANKLLPLMFICSFILLASNPPLGFAYDFLRESVPLFGQIFRSSFTKWVVPFSLLYSLLLTFGLAFLFSLLKKKWWQCLAGVVFFASLIFYAWPSFQGHFFYERLRVQIPEAYFAVFDYFKRQAPVSSRIANLPQHSFYGWQWNDWGYRGSGFLWYGIKQPILDRAFDVWSAPLEGYYWELQAALDQKDVKKLEAVLSKYDVDYLLLDTSVVNRNTVKPFNYAALQELLASSKRLKLSRQFDFISLYEFSDEENSREIDFVTLYDRLPIVANNYRFNWQDQAYLDFHDYLSDSNNFAKNASIIYPFPALFTNHSQVELEFDLSEDKNYFYLTSQNLAAVADKILLTPEPNRSEVLLPFQLTWQLEAEQLRLTLQALVPELVVNQIRTDFTFTQEVILDAKQCRQSASCFINLNNQLIAPFSSSGSAQVLLRTDLRNTLALSPDRPNEYFAYTFFDLAAYELAPRQVTLTAATAAPVIVKIPKITIVPDLVQSDLSTTAANNCRPLNQGSFFKERRSDGLLYQATGTSSCDHFYLENLLHKASYLFRLDASSLSSLPFVFAIQSASLGRSPLETYLTQGVNYQILPPTETFHHGYTLYLSTDSYGREVNQNLLHSAEVFWWPYNFLSQLRLQPAEFEEEQAVAVLSDCDFAVTKKALWFYQVNLPEQCSGSQLKLSQAYDQGWLAWSAGKFLSHAKFNNWANAWQLPAAIGAPQAIYIFFWPQLLQYLGFGLLVSGIIWLFFTNTARYASQSKQK